MTTRRNPPLPTDLPAALREIRRLRALLATETKTARYLRQRLAETERDLEDAWCELDQMRHAAIGWREVARRKVCAEMVH